MDDRDTNDPARDATDPGRSDDAPGVEQAGGPADPNPSQAGAGPLGPPRETGRPGAGKAIADGGADAVADGAGPSAAESLEDLASAVLDAAEVANDSARTAARATSNLLDAADRLDKAGARGQRNALYVLGVSGGLLLVSLLVFVTVASMLGTRLKRVDAMLAAVASRTVEMNRGLDNLLVIQDSLDELRRMQGALQESQAALEKRIDAVAKAAESLGKEVPARAAVEVGARNQALNTKVEEFEKSLSAQKSAFAQMERNLRTLSAAVGKVEAKVGGVEALNKDVSALVTLQRERYLEALQAEQRKREKPPQEGFVRFRGSAPAGQEEAKADKAGAPAAR